MTDREQRRLRRSVALHGFAVAVFAMLAVSGAGLAAPGLYGLAVPFIVAGLAGGVGAAVIAVAVWRQQRGEAGAAEPGGAPQRTVRLAMAAAAVVVLIAGVLLAPRGMDRGFVISVAALLAAALALFALLAGDKPRPRDPR
jgi:peptidoglycan/LPS O-acetylase OafA/YrhL